MTSQLVIGNRMKLGALKASWLKYNNDSGYQIRISQNIKRPKARYFSICYTAPKTSWTSADCCRAHVKAVGDTQDDLEIISVDLNHSCECSQDIRRKRNYLTRDIAEMSNVLDVYRPTSTKAGNTKQYIQMTRAATGVTMKTGQAALAVQSKCHDGIDVQLGQYFWIPSLLEAYRSDDPNGTYLYEWTHCGWDRSKRQFHRAYLCMSIAKHFWRHSVIRIIICDGTFTRTSAFHQIILVAVTFDGNNQIVILAFAIVPVEDAGNWVWFKEHLDSDFPGYNVWLSDKDKGITSNAFSQSMSQTSGQDGFVLSGCARHLAENCKEKCKGKGATMNEEQKLLIVELAKSRTEDMYQKRLAEIKNIRDDWALFLDQKKREIVTTYFLDKGV